MDIVADLGETFLGSRLKRLAERVQGGAARYVNGLGYDVQPTHMALLASLDRSSMTIGELAEAVGTSQPGITRGINQLIEKGLVESTRGADLRQKTLHLSPQAKAMMARVKVQVWPQLERAVKSITDELEGSFLDQIAGLERALAEKPLEMRAAEIQPPPSIREYAPELQSTFRDINVEWIAAMFRMEPSDREVLDDPETHILAGGGTILFVESPTLGVIGTCALRKTGAKSGELTKMGVTAVARGLRAGEFLLSAVIDRARQIGIEELYLLTNSKCEAAIHLYEKFGFMPDDRIMKKYGRRYQRSNVAMSYRMAG